MMLLILKELESLNCENKMDINEEPNVGQKIRLLREENSLSLRNLSELSSLSINAISKIERGEVSPTISSLHKLSIALNVLITDLFKQETHKIAVFTSKNGGLKIQSEGISIEGLGSGLPYQQLESFCMLIDAKTENSSDPAIHSGEEFVYCLDGEIEYFVDDQKFHLKPGDSLLFKASHPHSWNNPGRSQAKLLLIFQIDQYQPIPHRH
jgi:transcriptional regulator with XRE-family HTH domain